MTAAKTINTFKSAAEVREILAAMGYSKKVATKQATGSWVNESGYEVRVGMCLAPNFRTSQSSCGAGAPWVYSIANLA